MVELTDDLDDKIYQAFNHTNYEYVSMSKNARKERRKYYKGTIYEDASDDELAEKDNNELREQNLKSISLDSVAIEEEESLK